MRTRCLECRGWATHKGRCAEHHKAYESTRSRQSHSKRREAIARGTNAAARMRKALRANGYTPCAMCTRPCLASQLDVDHIKPLALGGEDIDTNVQPLCKACHRIKTRADFPGKRPPF